MQPEKRIRILKELTAAKKRLEEPTPFKGSIIPSTIFALISTFFGVCVFAFAIDIIAKHGVSFQSVLLLFLGFVFLSAQWYFIARYHFNRKLLLIYEALLVPHQLND